MTARGEMMSNGPPIGLVAGWGRYPIVVTEALQKAGHRVVCAGIRNHADPALEQLCDVHRRVGLAKLGHTIRFFRRQGVSCITLAGKIHKVQLFGRFGLLALLPDLFTIRTFFPHFLSQTRDRRDDTLLTTVVNAFAREGIRCTPATDLVPELLVKSGILTRHRPTAAQQRDIDYGWQVAKQMGLLDIGQTVVVKGQTVLAVEAIEGTDACIRRAGALCGSGGFTVIKTAKPQQDMRFDVPTVGLGTLHCLIESGAAVLAVEADKTILVDEPECLELANRHGIALVATLGAAGELSRAHAA